MRHVRPHPVPLFAFGLAPGGLKRLRGDLDADRRALLRPSTLIKQCVVTA